MQFKSSDNEVANTINILDKLINSNTSNTMEIIRSYKNTSELDVFTSFRLRKELARVNEQL